MSPRSSESNAQSYAQLVIFTEVAYHIMVDPLDRKYEVQSIQKPSGRFIRKPPRVRSIAAYHNTTACPVSVQERDTGYGGVLLTETLYTIQSLGCWA